jgi:hypothetical protein
MFQLIADIVPHLPGDAKVLAPAPRRLPAVLVAWHDSGPDFSVHVGGRLRCLNPFPREDLFVTPTTSRLHCKMGTLSASVE